MPSIKKRVTGFIRQFSGQQESSAQRPNAAADNNNRAPQREGGGASQQGFVRQYLNRSETRDPVRAILSGKTGAELPVVILSPGRDAHIFAAFTGPDGGVTSISRGANDHQDQSDGDEVFVDDVDGPRRRAASFPSSRPPGSADCEDFDFIDLEEGANSRRQSRDDALHDGSDKENQPGSGGDNRPRGSSRPSSCSSTRSRRRPREEVSVETDYPELGLDFPLAGGGARSSPGEQASSGQHPPRHLSNHLLTRRLKLDLRNDGDTVIAGVQHWNRPNKAATGQAVTLYERHPHTGESAGNPIADTFAVVARKNSGVLVLGDGVNWGPKAALASRCAVYAATELINDDIFGREGVVKNTQEVFQCLLRSFQAAHSLILQEDGQLTTLTACVVVPVEHSEQTKGGDSGMFAACVCNVGDSLAYVYSPRDGRVREITQDSHDISSNRDMRDALGALGPVDGRNPELNNLTCSLTLVDAGDIVFVTSDGVSDNFDPVLGKFCVPAKAEEEAEARGPPAMPPPVPATEAAEASPTKRLNGLMKGNQKHARGQNGEGDGSPKGKRRLRLTQSATPGTTQQAARQTQKPKLPSVQPHQRHELTLLRMEDILNLGSDLNAADKVSSNGGKRVETAAELCHRMVDFCQRLTTAKRKILEDPDLYPEHTRHALPDSDATRLDQKQRRRRVCEKLSQVPGKLDHATIAAYQVGDRREAMKHYTGGQTVTSKPKTNHVNGRRESNGVGSSSANLLIGLRAPCASSEDLTLRDSPDDDDDDDGQKTATPSLSLSSPSSTPQHDLLTATQEGAASLAVTPVHHHQSEND